MEAEDVASLARELQLLHVTKDFQRLVTAGPGAKGSAAGERAAGPHSRGLLCSWASLSAVPLGCRCWVCACG
jgi:hypothetical protein